MSLVERKNAFIEVLNEKLDKSIQTEVTAFWEEKYSTKPQFGISAFLEELYSRYDIEIKKGQLFKELSRATTRAGFATKNKSAGTISYNGNQKDLVHTAGLKVYQNLLDQLLASVKPTDRIKVDSAQLEGIANHKETPQSMQSIIHTWIKQGKAGMPLQMPLGTLRKLFNLAYVECCELYGPVKADQMLNKAIKHTEQMVEAERHSPVIFI
jgi:hypothetical protein